MSVYGPAHTSNESIPAGAPAPTAPRRFVDEPHFVLIDRPGSPLAERYRRLRMSLEDGTPDYPCRPQLIVITSAVPAEGKTTTATNLALAYAEVPGQRTLLVDVDLRRPSLSRSITPKPTAGLTEVLAGTVSLDQALIELAGTQLRLLPSGAPSETPLEHLQQQSFGELIRELRRRFDRIVIDAPPTVPFADAALLAAHADGALLVVRAGATTAPLIRRAKDSLSGTHVLGVLLNDVAFTVVDRYYDRYDEDDPAGYPLSTPS